MRQPKKLFTRILINNWGGISHKILDLNEYVNLFSGKSGSGKSTVMDAIQVVLYGSVSASFLNKAADDSKNKRSVLSYLRGAQKDGSVNRAGMDFCSQIVMEIEDTGTRIATCIGAAFEVGRNDSELRRYNFFSHSGRMPEDEYLADGVPYTIDQIRKLAKERSVSVDNRGHGDVNRVYPSKEAYLNTLYEVIFGYVEPGRMITMEKSAIALRMSNGTGQFIRDYMFPKSRENTVAVISEQLGAYREIRERVEDLEKRIGMLDAVHAADLELTGVRADKLHSETILRYIDIEGCRAKLAFRGDDLERAKEASVRAQQRQAGVQEELTALRNRLIDVKAELKNSDYGQKQQELQEMISEITHQIKTPLSNIRMYCEMIGENASPGSGKTILRQTDSSQLRQYSATVGDQLDRLDFLLNALIRSSRLETSMIRLQPENNKVLDTIAIAVNNVFQKAEDKKIEIRVSCRSTIEVCHDPKWTAEAIENLLDNAIKYTPENGKIQIDVVPGEMYVEIQVKDTGCGIAADEVNEIFKRFYRGKAVSRVEGLGLGLYLAQKIITLQGGFLSVRSEPEKGSCFSIHLKR